MKSINIKGKDYIPVNERLKHFRANYPEYSLVSELIQVTEEHCVVKAQIANPDGVLMASAHAHEEKQGNYINKTSFIENCETSAWGRVLGNFGIGIDTSVASADEVKTATTKKSPAQNKSADDKNLKPSKMKMTAPILESMLKYIEDGKGDTVKENLVKYSMTKPQQTLINEALKGN